MAAQHEWVYPLDYDDIPTVNGLDNLLTCVQEENKVWGHARSIDIDEDGHTYDPKNKFIPWLKTIPHDGFFQAYKTNGRYPFLCAGPTIIKTAVAKAVGGWSAQFSFRGQDVPLFSRLSFQHEGAYLDEAIHLYRKHSLSTTAKPADQAYESRLLQYVEQVRVSSLPVQ